MSDMPSIPTWQRPFDPMPRPGCTLRARAAEELRLLRAERMAISPYPDDAYGAPARSGGAA
jgi:hypothetical protein